MFQSAGLLAQRIRIYANNGFRCGPTPRCCQIPRVVKRSAGIVKSPARKSLSSRGRWGYLDLAGGTALIIRRLIVPLAVAVVSACAGPVMAQGAFPAPLPGQAVQPNDPAFPPVPGQSRARATIRHFRRCPVDPRSATTRHFLPSTARRRWRRSARRRLRSRSMARRRSPAADSSGRRRRQRRRVVRRTSA